MFELSYIISEIVTILLILLLLYSLSIISFLCYLYVSLRIEISFGTFGLVVIKIYNNHSHNVIVICIVTHYVRNLLNAVERLFKFLVVLPASSATAERSFSSSLRRLKNYLRLTRPMTLIMSLYIMSTRQESTP